MIEIKNISKSYDKVILDDVSCQIPDGSIVGLVGVNGVGKSTLLRLLAGVYEPDKGQILYDGVNIFEDEGVKKNIFYVPDFPTVKGLDTPMSLINDYKFWFNKMTYTVDYMAHLNEFNIPYRGNISKFSKGMKRQTFIALGIALGTKYLLLDEVFDGVDPIARKTLKQSLLKMQEKTNSTIILSSHSLRELEEICDIYLVVDNTKLYLYNNVSEFNYHKYIMVFNDDLKEEDFDIDFVSFEKENKIITCITKLSYEEMQEIINKYEPKLLEEQDMNVEESFITRIGIEEES